MSPNIETVQCTAAFSFAPEMRFKTHQLLLLRHPTPHL